MRQLPYSCLPDWKAPCRRGQGSLLQYQGTVAEHSYLLVHIFTGPTLYPEQCCFDLACGMSLSGQAKALIDWLLVFLCMFGKTSKRNGKGICAHKAEFCCTLWSQRISTSVITFAGYFPLTCAFWVKCCWFIFTITVFMWEERVELSSVWELGV